MVLSLGVDKLNPGNPDIAIGARSVFLDRRRSERSANGRYLLNYFVWCELNLRPDGISLYEPQFMRKCRYVRAKVNSIFYNENHPQRQNSLSIGIFPRKSAQSGILIWLPIRITSL